jgi:hypothetical protein
MKKFILISLVTLATVCFRHQCNAQGTLAPLYLFTNGAGSITPLQDGQLLEVGQNYEMTAIPDSGFLFSSWQPVNVFALTTAVIDYNTGPPTTNLVTSTDLSPVPEYIEQPVLEFTMQPEEVIYNNPGGSTITRSSGWQVNFVPVPEPSCLTLFVCGLTIAVFFRASRFNRTTMFSNKSLQPTRDGVLSFLGSRGLSGRSRVAEFWTSIRFQYRHTPTPLCLIHRSGMRIFGTLFMCSTINIHLPSTKHGR